MNNGEWRLPLVGLIADVAGILAFLGLADSRPFRLAIGGACGLVAILIGGFELVRSVRLWLSPRGAYYSTSFHRSHISAGFALLAIGCVLAFAFIRIADSSTDKGKTQIDP